MSILVTRYQRNQKLGDPSSPLLYYLKFEPGRGRTYIDEDIARDVEEIGSLSKGDFVHVVRALTSQMRKILTAGDKVKLAGLGTFSLSFNCTGTAEEKDCTVRNIHKVNIRFKPDSRLRLVNDSTATTRGSDNNVKFKIKSDTDSNQDPGGNDDGNDDGGGFEDPNA